MYDNILTLLKTGSNSKKANFIQETFSFFGMQDKDGVELDFIDIKRLLPVEPVLVSPYIVNDYNRFFHIYKCKINNYWIISAHSTEPNLGDNDSCLAITEETLRSVDKRAHEILAEKEPVIKVFRVPLTVNVSVELREEDAIQEKIQKKMRNMNYSQFIEGIEWSKIEPTD